MTNKHLDIALLVYPDCLPSTLFGFRDIILFANELARYHNKEPIKMALISARETTVSLAGNLGVQVIPAKGQRFHNLVVPGFMYANPGSISPQIQTLQAEIALLKRAYTQGAVIASNCVGAFLLGAAGLLENRQATTAWLLEKRLQTLFAGAHVNGSRTLLQDGRIITTGAFSAMQDLAMYFIRKHLGQTIEQQTRNITLTLSVGESQSKFVDHSLLASKASGFAGSVENWLTQHLSQRYSLEDLASHMAVSPRTLMRRYQKEKGRTPLAYLQRKRMERAKHLLVSSALSIEQIAAEVGYQDVNAFRQLFRREVQETPSAYRKQFR